MPYFVKIILLLLDDLAPLLRPLGFLADLFLELSLEIGSLRNLILFKQLL